MNEKPTARVRVIIYTRPGCHLCDEAKAEIARANCSELFTLEEIDINSDPALAARYGYDIPVVTINGLHAFKHRLTSKEFTRALRRARESHDS